METKKGKTDSNAMDSNAATLPNVDGLGDQANNTNINMTAMHNTIMSLDSQGNSCSVLDLGADKNYKTKVIQTRWDQERQKWLDKASKTDPRDGVPVGQIPIDHKKKTVDNSMSIRRRIKHTMRSVQSPYMPFESYYPLEEVIDTYMEIWYQSDSSDSSSS